MKKNFWVWSVLAASLIYGLLFWYSQVMTDHNEMDNYSFMNEESPLDHAGFPRQSQTSIDSMRI